MKRFWLVLLSLGLVLAFSASAMAVDVKFSGSFYAAGMYLDKTKFVKDTASDGGSTAFYYQRLRLQTDFIVSPGLKLVTRFDAMERAWGAGRSNPGTTLDIDSSGTVAENENIAFDWAYISYTSPIGIFNVGYMATGAWGTVFSDSLITIGRIQWTGQFGPVILGGYVGKSGELSKTAKNPTLTTDQDSDKYVLYGIYNINKDINVGLLYSGSRVATYKVNYPTAPNPGAMMYVGVLEPYVKAKIGPVYVEAEVDYAWGTYPGYEDGYLGHDVKLENILAYVNAVVDLGPVYFGGTAAYMSGDDPGTKEKKEGGVLTGGTDWNPCLIMFNYERTYWAGAINGYQTTSNSSPMSNAWFGQGKVGVRPIPPLDINASLSYARAESRPLNTITDKKAYGWEVDVAGTYKITNNLAYMLGVGYLFTGDYYKGTSDGPSLRDDFLVINKLTLTF